MTRVPSHSGRPGVRNLGLAGALALGLACGGGGGEEVATGPSGRVTLTGRVPAAGSLAAAANTVLLFAPDGSFRADPVSSGAFSVAVYPGTALAMVFTGLGGQPLGYLALGSGIGSLPLTQVANGVDTINLGQLTAFGQALAPANNPIASGQLPLTDAEQAAFAQCNGLFAGLARNPDVDGDRVIDLLQGRFYHPFVSYWVDGGHFAGRLTATVDSGVAIRNHNLTVVAEGGSAGSAATVTGPPGSGLSRSCTVATSDARTSYSVYPDLRTSATAVPMSGDYLFSTSQGSTLTITVPDQGAAGRDTVVAVPTVAISADHTIHSVSWSYQTLGGQVIPSPGVVIQDVAVGIDRGDGNRVYTSSALGALATTRVIPADTSIPWDSSICITMEMHDIFQNYYKVSFYNSF